MWIRLFLALGLLLFGSACNTRTFGSGLGRPDFKAVERAQTHDLALTEVYVAADEADSFVEIVNNGSTAVDLADLSLVGATGSIDLTGSLAAGGFVEQGLAGMTLSAFADELAVIDAQGVVHAYLAWGADPAIFGSPYAARFVGAGRMQPGEFVALPYPMDAGVAVVKIGNASGCATPSVGAAAEADHINNAEHCPAAAAPVQLSEFFTNAWSSGASWVELTNASAAPLPLHGVRLCQQPWCIVFGRDHSLPANGIVRVLVGAELAEGDNPDVTWAFPQAARIGAIGELMLLTPGPASVGADFNNFASFVRYGEAPASHVAAAVAAEKWPSIDDTAKPPRVSGESLSLDPAPADPSSPKWYPATATPGVANPDISATDWRSCSEANLLNVAKPGAALVIYRVARTGDGVLTLHNTGDDDVDLSNYTLALGTTERALGQDPNFLSLGMSRSLTMKIVPSGTKECTDADVCWEVDDVSIGASGEATLLETTLLETTIVQHLQWGTPPGVRAAGAVAVNAWPREDCAIQTLPEEGTIELQLSLSGQAPPDYSVQ